jgi:hypothetical protein
METTTRKPRDFDAELRALEDKARDFYYGWPTSSKAIRREHARRLWAEKGKQAFAVERPTDALPDAKQTPCDQA